MAGSDGNVEIRITGAVDSSLPAASAQAQSELTALASRAQAFGGTGALSAKQFSDALKSVDGDLSKLTPEMLGIGAAAEQGIGTVASVARTAETATTGLHFATSGAIQEYIRLGHEALTGNLSRMPGSLIVLTSRMGGLTGETLAAAGGMAALGLAIAAPIAGMAYLAYRQYEANRNAAALAEGFALTGRAADASTISVQAELNTLSNMPGVTSAVAQGIVAWEAAHGEIDDRINTFVNQLAPQFVQASGDMPKAAIKAIGELKSELNEVVTGSIQQAIAAFDKLDKTNLHLSTSTDAAKRALADQILKLIESGQRVDAMLALLQLLATQGGGHIDTLGQKIEDTKTKLAEAEHRVELFKEAAASPQQPEAINVIANALAAAVQRAEELRAQLAGLEGQAAQPKVNVAISAENVSEKIRSIQQDLNLTDTQQLQKIVSYLNGVTSAEVDSSATRKQIATALAEYKTELARKTGQDEIEASRESAQSSGVSGEELTRKLIAVDREELDSGRVTAQQKLEIRKDLARRIAELSAEETADAKRGSHEAAKDARTAAEETLHGYQEEAQAAREGSVERIEADQKWLAAALKVQKELPNAAHEARDAIIRDERAMADEAIRDAQATAQVQVKAINDWAQAEQKALEQAVKYDNLTAEQEIANAIRIENARYEAEQSALFQSLALAGNNRDALRQIEKQIEESDAEHWKRMADNARHGIDLQVQQWERLNNRVLSLEDSLVQGIFEGNLNIRQIGLRFLEQMIADDLKYWTERTLLAAEHVPVENAIEHGGLTDFIRIISQKTAVTASGEAAKTSAVAAGAATRTGIETTAAAVGNAAEATADSTSIVNSAYTAAASAFKWVMQEVPFPLNVALAPVAAAAAFTGVAAFDVIKSAEGGDYNVTAGLYRLHDDEMVWPSAEAQGIRSVVQHMQSLPLAANTFDGSIAGAYAAHAISMPDPFSLLAGASAAHGESPASGASPGGDTHFHLHNPAFNNVKDPDSFKAWLNSAEGKREMHKHFASMSRIPPR